MYRRGVKKISKQVEKRTLSIRDIQTNNDEMTVSGYVNKVGSVSEVLSIDGQVFQEKILPQAFTDALNQDDEICFYLEHDPSKILATTKNGSLQLSQDDTGLKMQATIVDTSDGKNAYELIKTGIITNMSFGFLVEDDIWTDDNDSDIPLRTVTKLYLSEVSAVKNPAYTDSEINARCKNNNIDKLSFRGFSHVNLTDKGGEQVKQDITKFSDEELQAEMDKRSNNSKEKDTEKRSIEDATIELALRSAEMVSKTIDKLNLSEKRSEESNEKDESKAKENEKSERDSDENGSDEEKRSLDKQMDSIKKYLNKGEKDD